MKVGCLNGILMYNLALGWTLSKLNNPLYEMMLIVLAQSLIVKLSFKKILELNQDVT